MADRKGMLIYRLRQIAKRIVGYKPLADFDRECDADKVSCMLRELLTADKPAMVARYGATELLCLLNYLGVQRGKPSRLDYMRGKALDWEWKDVTLEHMRDWSGFFPATVTNIERFAEMMLKESQSLDILVSWLPNERWLEPYIGTNKFIQGLMLDPFWAATPWTKALEGQRVLVVHPFARLMQKQYDEKREKLFANKDVLPRFESLTCVPAVQSLGGEDNGFKDWFEALEHMKRQIDKVEYDVCLLGCGAYGFPLAAHCKQMGKKAIHMGGSLQLLFGIIGKRWENPMYGSKELKCEGMYPSLINEYWVRPGTEGRPQNAKQVEGACYW